MINMFQTYNRPYIDRFLGAPASGYIRSKGFSKSTKNCPYFAPALVSESNAFEW